VPAAPAVGVPAEPPVVDPVAFARTVERVSAYIRSEPGSWAALAAQTREDPEGTMRAMLALGTVLLDISAGAFDLAPDEMLDKVRLTVDLQRLAESRRGDSR
jgi:hypothetical protein